MLCRLCLIDSTEVLNIFEGDGERFQIANIIGQHFWFVPIKDDQISNICCTCWLKVDGFHQFYCFVKDAQKKLSGIFLTDQKSHQETTRTYLKQENNDDGNDEWMYDTEVKEYVNVIQDNNVNENIEIKSEHCDNNESIDDKFEVVKDPIDTDNTSQNKGFVLKIQAKTCNDDADTPSKGKTSSKTKSKNKVKKKVGHPKKSPNISDSEEDLPLKHLVEQKSKRDKNEKSEYLEKSEERDDFITNFMTLKCEICYEECKTFSQIKKHYRTKHNAKGYVVCCNKKLYRKYALFDHISIHLNPENYKCDKCNRIFSHEQSLKTHSLKHESKYKCDQCHKKYPKEYLLAKHKLSHIPQEERQFKCDDCERAFPTMNLLQRHCRAVHENAYGIMCHICAKIINGKSLFEKHQLEHAGIEEPKAQCQKCGKWLKDKYCLAKHMVRHTDRLFIHKCEICEKILTTRSQLKEHIRRVHEPRRPHKCGICEKAFKVPLRLKEHMTTHTGEILYTCPHCPKTFNAKSNLYAHRKKKHRKEWEELRKDLVVPFNKISDATFEDDKNNQNGSIEDNSEDNSQKFSENEMNEHNEQNLISLVLDTMQAKN